MKTITETQNGAFLDRRQEAQERRTLREYLLCTVRIDDPEWQPQGSRTRPPQASQNYTFGDACRLALFLNLRRMAGNLAHLSHWTIVSGRGQRKNRNWHLLTIPTRSRRRPVWRPADQFGLPPQVNRIALPPERFQHWLREHNTRQFRERRLWTVIVSQLTPADLTDGQPSILQDVNRALSRPRTPSGSTSDRPQQPTNGTPAANGVPESNGARRLVNESHRLYQIGLADDRGTVRRFGEPLPQSQALDLMERYSSSAPVLLPVNGSEVRS